MLEELGTLTIGTVVVVILIGLFLFIMKYKLTTALFGIALFFGISYCVGKIVRLYTEWW